MTITETAMDELADEMERLRAAITAATTRLERAFDVWIEAERAKVAS